MTHRVISFHYTLTNPQGEKLDSSIGHAPLTYLEGVGQIIPGLEKELQNLKVSDKKKITVPASEAYGLREEKYVVSVPRDKFPEGEISVGDQFQPGEDPNAHPFTVTEISDSHVTLDANHPLAGVDLTFDVEVITIREATAEELSHGHSHGPDGHHH